MGLTAYLLAGSVGITLLLGTVEEARLAYYRGQLASIQAKSIEVLKTSFDQGRAYQISEDAASLDVGKKVVEYRDRIQTKTVILTKRIPTFVPPEAVRACIVNRGSVQLLNDAASNQNQAAAVPNAASGAVGADSHVGLDTVAGTVTSNYGKCNIAFATIDGWKDWYVRARAIYDDWAVKQ